MDESPDHAEVGSPDLQDRLREHLRASTSGSRSPDLDEVRRRGRRHRRSRRLAGAGVVVSFVAAAGVVVAVVTGGGGGGDLRMSDGTDDDRVTATSTTESTLDVTSPGSTPAPTEPTPTPGNADTEHLVVPVVASPGARALAWGGGFLLVETEVEWGRIEPLSEDVLAAFSEDVRALFEEQPSSIDEAVAVLSEHPDLLAEVEGVLAERPDVRAAIYGSRGRTTLAFSTSEDGRSWHPAGRLEVPTQIESVSWIVAHHDTIVVVGTGRSDASGDGVATEVIGIAVTSDLAAWSAVDTLDPVDATPVAEHPAPSRWVSGVDVGPSGVIIAVDQLSPSPEHATPGTDPSSAGPKRSTTIWTGDPAEGLVQVELDLDAQSANHVIAPPAGGFAVIATERSTTVHSSLDGRSWERSPVELDARSWVSAAVQVLDGIGLVTAGADGAALWRSSADLASWERFEIPTTAPRGASWISHADGGPGGLAVIDSVQPVAPSVPPLVAILERDGVRLEMTIDERGGRFLATGPGADGPETVLLDWSVIDDPPADRVEITDDGVFTILDPTTGEPIVSFDEADAAAAFAAAEDANGGDAATATTVPPEWMPEYEIAHSPDGVNWRVLDRFSPGSSDGSTPDDTPTSIAVNDDTVVVVVESSTADGALRRTFLVYDV